MAMNPFKTFLLPELLKGMSVTARTFFQRKYTLNYPGREDPAVASLPWTACAAPLCER